MTIRFAMRMQQKSRRRVRGFTLIELMIVVAIIAILAGIAYASYDFAMIKSRRNAAAGCALEGAQFMERYYTTNLTYVDAALPASDCQNQVEDHYTISLAASDANSYTISAKPKGHQATKDAKKCGTLSVDQTGAKSVSGSSSASDCW